MFDPNGHLSAFLSEEIEYDTPDNVALAILTNKALSKGELYWITHYNGNQACWALNLSSELFGALSQEAQTAIVETCAHITVSRCETPTISTRGMFEV